MKVLLSIIALSLLPVAANAIVVENVVQYSFIQPACDVCQGGAKVTKTIFDISFVSCANMDGQFSLNIKERPQGLSGKMEKFVSVELPTQLVDCFGPSSRKNYSISTDKLKAGESYILSTPSRLKPSSDLQ